MFFGLTAPGQPVHDASELPRHRHLPSRAGAADARSGPAGAILAETPVITDEHPNTLVPEMIADSTRQAGQDVTAWGGSPTTSPGRSRSLMEEARADGRSPWSSHEAQLDGYGHELVMLPFINYNRGNLDAVHRMLSHPQAFPALGRCRRPCRRDLRHLVLDFALGYWTRDRSSGPRIPLEQVWRKLTAADRRHFRPERSAASSATVCAPTSTH